MNPVVIAGPRSPAYFCYPNPPGFSGQKAATELVIEGLEKRGWACRRLPQPVLDRANDGRWARVHFLMSLLAAWARSLRLLGARGSRLCVNLGQTRAAFLRDGIPLILGRVGLGRERVTVSLHGSLFMVWKEDAPEVRMFRFLLGQAGMITVLGERQRARLLALGVPEERVTVLVNSCAEQPVSVAAAAAKHPARGERTDAVRCLHLSSLIDTKGFPEYLEAFLLLSELPGRGIDAVLCGRLIPSEFSGRFPDVVAAEAWITEQMALINRGPRVRIRWVKGAVGREKSGLFRDAQVFVLPTRYAVEAQPLVLLEAMASGCAIVTTRAGEIPTILDEGSAILLPEGSAAAVATALQALVSDAAARARLAGSAHARYLGEYRLERHLDRWELLLAPGGQPGGGTT